MESGLWFYYLGGVSKLGPWLRDSGSRRSQQEPTPPTWSATSEVLAMGYPAFSSFLPEREQTCSYALESCPTLTQYRASKKSSRP